MAYVRWCDCDMYCFYNVNNKLTVMPLSWSQEMEKDPKCDDKIHFSIIECAELLTYPNEALKSIFNCSSLGVQMLQISILGFLFNKLFERNKKTDLYAYQRFSLIDTLLRKKIKPYPNKWKRTRGITGDYFFKEKD